MAGKSRQELGLEGQRHLEETIDAAFHILFYMNSELCNSSLWSTPSSSSAATTDHPSIAAATAASSGAGGRYLYEVRLLYKSAVAALLALLATIPNWPQEMHMEVKSDPADIERLENRASILRKELANKLKHRKVLIDQL